MKVEEVNMSALKQTNYRATNAVPRTVLSQPKRRTSEVIDYDLLCNEVMAKFPRILKRLAE
jgi:hypothetical protein